MIKKIIGALMLCIFFIVLFLCVVDQVGFYEALKGFAICIGVFIFVVIGAKLLTSD